MNLKSKPFTRVWLKLGQVSTVDIMSVGFVVFTVRLSALRTVCTSITPPAFWEKTAVLSPTDLLESGWTTHRNPEAGKLYLSHRKRTNRLYWVSSRNPSSFSKTDKTENFNKQLCCMEWEILPNRLKKYYKILLQNKSDFFFLELDINITIHQLYHNAFYKPKRNLPACFVLLSDSFSFAAQS